MDSPVTIEWAIKRREAELKAERNYLTILEGTILTLTYKQCQAKINELENEIELLRAKQKEAV